jgi:SAM-dependent methyltransferase
MGSSDAGERASSDAAKNVELWTQANAEYTDKNAETNWALDEISWGIWGVDESELNVLGDVAGLDVVELGCGTAYVSAWLAKRGARPVGVDVTPAQLATARRMMARTGIEFPLVEADAAETGLPDASADLVVSEYGASIWVDPYRWIPEAARLLRPGGRLAFLRNSTLVILCSEDEWPAGERLVHPQFGMHRFEWPEGGVEFHLSHGEWIDVLRANGFEIERLIEVQAPDDAVTHERYAYVTAEWARKWPSEEIWVARKPLVAVGSTEAKQS